MSTQLSRPSDETSGGLSRFLRALRERLLLVVAILAVSVGAAYALWSSQEKTYEAEALLQLTPVAADSETYAGISGLISDRSSLTRDVETLSRIIATNDVATEARRVLGTSRSADDLLGDVAVNPVGQSYVVSILAQGGTPKEAADLATAFAQATVNVKGRAFRAQVRALVTQLQQQVREASARLPQPAAGQAGQAEPPELSQLRNRLVQVTALQNAGDPTIQLADTPVPPTSPTNPGLPLVLFVALLVGSVVASAVVLALNATDRKVRTERQLVEEFGAPVVARVPMPFTRRRLSGRRGESARTIRDLTPVGVEAYRALGQNLTVLRRDFDYPRTVLFNSVRHGEGKTTVAINTAVALAEAGSSVILVDADLRSPAIGREFGVSPTYGVEDVLHGQVPLDDALVEVGSFRGRLDLLLHVPRDGHTGHAIEPSALRRLIDAAVYREADFVVFDAAPLGLGAAALPSPTRVDDVLVVVREDHTTLDGLREIHELFGRHGVQPRSFVVMGRAPGRRADLEGLPRGRGSATPTR